MTALVRNEHPADVVAEPGGPTRPRVSVVIAARNEAENLERLLAEIQEALGGKIRYEVIVVDDGSDDASPAVLATLQGRYPNLVTRRHASPCGQSAGMRTAILAATGTVIATIDGDGQNDPADLPRLIRVFEDGPAEVGIVIGWRKERNDTWRKRRASRIANGIRARILNDATPDTGCGLKVFTREMFLILPYFDHMHRFLPALMLREGFVSVSVPVAHRARIAGTSKYGVWDRALVGVVDILGVLWLQRRRRLPLKVTGEPRE
jgi:dolichol-phosphate mannosyltransferase